jgi:hypothetical protein
MNEIGDLVVLSVDGKIILKPIFSNSFGRARSALILPGIGRSGRPWKAL